MPRPHRRAKLSMRKSPNVSAMRGRIGKARMHFMRWRLGSLKSESALFLFAQGQFVMAKLLYEDYLRRLSARFAANVSEIETFYNFDLGDEFEFAIVKSLRAVLPTKCGICRGHVVDKNGEQAGDDLIIFD